jgi:hypothetical protein
MGITKKYFDLYCKQYFEISNSILELGAQDLLVDGNSLGYFKNIYSNYNIESLDITGENNSLKLDLSTELYIHKQYDLITNFGTSEHVSNQYTCWKNIHSLLNTNGIVISEIPEIGSWKGHCKYYIDYSFFKTMNKDFEIIDYRSIYYPNNGYLSYSVLKKISETFLTSKDDMLKTIVIDDNVNDKISF